MRDLIATYGEPVIVRRRSAGQFVDGRWVEGSVQIIELVASIQPLSGFELQQLPELQRVRAVKKMYTSEPLYTTGQNTSPDIVEYQGALWEVQSVEPWRKFMIHTKAIIMRVS